MFSLANFSLQAGTTIEFEWGILRAELQTQFCLVKSRKPKEILGMQIRCAQSLGRVWIDRREASRPFWGPFQAGAGCK